MGQVVQVYQPKLFKKINFLLGGESKRHGGISPKPYQSLNLGLNTFDNYKNVTENRNRLFSVLKVKDDQTAFLDQVHGSEVLEVQTSGHWKGFDAMITQKKNLFLFIGIADCTPILIFDQKNEVVAAIHAGWRGVVGEIVMKTLWKMRKVFNTASKDCLVYIGTCIDKNSFEVDEDVAQYFSPEHKKWDEFRQKFLIDLKGSILGELQSLGVPKHQIEVSPFSTVIHNEDYFSLSKRKRNNRSYVSLYWYAELIFKTCDGLTSAVNLKLENIWTAIVSRWVKVLTFFSNFLMIDGCHK